MPSREERHQKHRERMKVLDLSAVGLAFPIAMAFGYFVGRMIGGWFDAARIGGMIGLFFGIAGGFYNFLKLVMRFSPPSQPPSDDAADAAAEAAADGE